jgi:hypothetical protein
MTKLVCYLPVILISWKFSFRLVIVNCSVNDSRLIFSLVWWGLVPEVHPKQRPPVIFIKQD